MFAIGQAEVERLREALADSRRGSAERVLTVLFAAACLAPRVGWRIANARCSGALRPS